MMQGDAISNDKNETEWNLGGRDKRNLVIVDVYTTWTILVGIFFPSVTGEDDDLVLLNHPHQQPLPMCNCFSAISIF